MLLLAGSAGLSKRVNFAASLLQQEPRSLANAHAIGQCARHGRDLDLLDAPSTAVEQKTR